MPFPTDIQYVERAAKRLGLRFPSAYVDFLLHSNGGDLSADDDEWQLYPVFDDTDRKRAARTCNDVVHETNEARVWSKFPQDAVAIAGNGTGDQLLLRCDSNGKLSSAIFRWDHETGECTQIAQDIGELADAG